MRNLSLFSEKDFKRNPKLVAQGAIGQNLVMATPLQMAMVAETVANKGLVMNPFIIKSINYGSAPGEEIKLEDRYAEFEPQVICRAVKERTASYIKNLMEWVMKFGTGKGLKKIYKNGEEYFLAHKADNCVEIQAAGKTGTAEVGDKNQNGLIDADEKEHSWFIGFVPADNPHIAVSVIVENGGFGAEVAAPVAMELFSTALNMEK